MELLQVQFDIAMLTHFICHAARKMEFPDLDSTKYAASVMSSQAGFQRSEEVRLK